MSTPRGPIFFVRVAVSFAVLTLGSLAMLLTGIVTLFMARRLYSEGLLPWIGRTILRIWGVQYRVHGRASVPAGQCVYISNHSSTLDIMILIAMVLPRTRFFLRGSLRRKVPIAIVGYLIRIFWTVPQDYPDKRRRIFQRAARILQRTGDSVYLSPEGRIVEGGGIGHFNKGAFHLATSMAVPIVPMFLAIPDFMNPGKRYNAQAGTVDVWFLPAIATADWRVEDVQRNRDHVHDLYLRVYDEVRAGRSPAAMTISEESALEMTAR